MATVTVITNNKGGVAKTTTVTNLAAALRRGGFDVLCIDLDGQCNLTETLGVDTSTVQGTTYDTLKKRNAPYVQPVRVLPSGEGVGVVDVLPSERDMFAAEAMLTNEPDRVTRFAAVVDGYRDKYDVILIDTTPTIGLLSISALYAADNAIITTNPDYLATRGLVSVRDIINDVNGNRPAPLGYKVLFCKYDKRKGLHRLTVEQVRAAFPTFATVVRDNVALSEAPAAHTDIFRYAPRSYGAQDYEAIAAEYVKAYRLRHRKHK
jgi:chromosome partitioning protein